MTGKRERADYA